MPLKIIRPLCRLWKTLINPNEELLLFNVMERNPMEYRNETNAICNRLKIEPEIPLNDSKLGIALSTLKKDPINGLRHPVTDDANGWYIWCGDDISQVYWSYPIFYVHNGNSI